MRWLSSTAPIRTEDNWTEASKPASLTRVLDAGAVDIICKPQVGIRDFLEESRIRICDVVKAAAQARLVRLRQTAPAAKLTADAMLPAPSNRAMAKTTERVIAIGASTGGTEAVRIFLEAMPVDCPPILIVQHLPEGFTDAFARRLDSICAISVKEAAQGLGGWQPQC